MYIETERLVIRSMCPSDANAFIEMASDQSLDRDIFPGRSRAYGEWMGRWIREAMEAEEKDDPKDWLAFAIAEKNGGNVIGSVGCSFNDELEEVGLVYFIGANKRGNGYAREAAAAFSAHLLKKYALTKILTTVRKENVASCKTIEKAGFSLKEERMYRDYYDDKPYVYRFYEMKL